MFLYFFSLAIVTFEAICCKLFFESFCYTPKERKKFHEILLICIMTLLFYLCGLMLSELLMVKQIVGLVLIALVMGCYFGISINKAVVFSIAYQGILLLVDYLAYTGNSAIISREGEVHHEYAVKGNLVIIFSKIILFLCILLIKKQFGKKSAIDLPDAVWIKFLFFPFFTTIIIAGLLMTFEYTQNQAQADVLNIIAFGTVIMNVFVYYLINDIVVRENHLHEKNMLKLQVDDQIKMYRSISENFELQKRKSHEFKNQLLCIEALLKEQQYSKANQYVSKISKNFNGEHNAINTNHVIINAMLNAKYQEAINKQIVFVFRVNDLSRISLEDEDLVVILANLLNNAIEACEKCEDKRRIKFKFMLEDGLVILSIKNTYNHTLIYDNDEIKTSKEVTPDEHGVGIKNIIRIVEKYSGSYIIQHDEDEFYFSIMLPS